MPVPVAPVPVFADPNTVPVQSNDTLVASGSVVYSGYGASEVSLFINVKAAPTGTSPTLQYTIQEVDPGDQTTVIGQVATSTVITGIGIQRITLESAFGGAILVTWTVTGAGASFTQVYATLVNKWASVKIVDTSGNPINATNPQPVSDLVNQTASFAPDPKSTPVEGLTGLSTDTFGQLKARATVLTDEESFRDDFPGDDLLTGLTGTVQFTNGSTTVTGVGTAFIAELGNQDYIRATAHGNSSLTRVATVISDTELELTAPYPDATVNAAASKSRWMILTDGTSSYTVGSSLVNLIADGTNGDSVRINRDGDYLPFVLSAYFKQTVRNASQESVFGFQDVPGVNAANQAVVVLDGTDPTQIKFRTSSGTTATDRQETTITLPNDFTTATMAFAEIDVSTNLTTLSINGVLVASHDKHTPDPYAVMGIVGYVRNTGATATTTFSLDLMFFQNTDQLVVANLFRGQPIAVSTVNPNASVMATLTAVNDTVSAPAGVGSSIGINVLGSWVGTLQFEGSVDGVTWVPIRGLPLAGGAGTTTTTTNGTWVMPGGAIAQVRVKMTAFTSGSASITVLTTEGERTNRVFNSDYGELLATVKDAVAPTGTVTSVTSSTSSVTLLAANANRRGATIYNDSTSNLFVKFGATASSSSFTVRMATQTFFSVPAWYSGIIDGIWTSVNGAARVTEIT